VKDGFLLAGARVENLDAYRAVGGGGAIETAVSMGPALVRHEVLLSGLRGRGGGGFRTGRKWTGVVESGPRPRFAVCNAAEGEPGTFKDRALLAHNPYLTLEGLVIAALAVEATDAYIATKRSYVEQAARLRAGIDEMHAASMTAGVTLHLVEGPDDYLFGEEKALLEVIEGRDPLPRILPPYEHGLFATSAVTGWEAGSALVESAIEHPNPTAVNNAETLANVPFILQQGAEWFRSYGTEQSPGTLLVTVVGDVRSSLVAEVEMGTPLSSLIERAGGAREGHTLSYGFSGVSNPVISPDRFGTPLAYETFEAARLGLGSAGFFFFDETACPVEVARAISQFLYDESCGQCRSCKYGCGEITRRLELLGRGQASENDIAVIGVRLRTVNEAVRCYLATEEQIVVASILERCPEEFALHLEGHCSKPDLRPVTVPFVESVASCN
jgi:NADH:ubiquinone oxidoreductase subunit F (NADH-binding)